MAVHHAATTLAAEGLPAGLKALPSLAVTVLDAHTNATVLCAVCGCAWPCELVLRADHNYGPAAMSCRLSWVEPAARPGGAAGPTLAAFRALVEALRRSRINTVIIPAPEHFSRFGGMYWAMCTVIDMETGADVLVMSSMGGGAS